MIDKELKEKLEELNGLLRDVVEDNKQGLIDKLNDRLEKAHKEKVIISVEKDIDGKAETKIEGTRLALLVTLAGLEKSVLNQLHCSEGEFEIIKSSVGVREAE